MGQALVRCAENDPELEVAGTVDLGDDLAPAIEASEVIIDFSFHDATREIAELAAAQSKPIVIGTTGHSDEDRGAIEALAQTIPMVWASNYSTGVNTLFWLTRKTAEVLGSDFDLEVIEMHHHHKQDAPSGTAATLGKILAEVRGLQVKEAFRHGREGIVGARTRDEIGMHSLRGGDVVGDHTVVYATNGERLELTHRAASRDTFANGALRASKWVLGRSPGLYSMQDVLWLKD
ncbi:MAG: 4-hydroxy-tetrahydrodipicolinate reductase [Verrucomicrobia subdivision 3 bacterium]|nr:4-hydroxy-tetrahydrodipicolinate reductase [Limisphaerales bacterium]MCS1412807.1 4-hydroxy-tetrahydrodipicolinate reductase [Limisphaerales bacterium]